MKHEMGLQDNWFDYILKGTKRYELRLFDEKRKKIKLGDTIEFTSKNGRKMECDVVSFIIAPDFHRLLQLVPHLYEVAYYSMTRRYMEIIMERFYPIKKQRENGVIAIGLSKPRPINFANVKAG